MGAERLRRANEELRQAQTRLSLASSAFQTRLALLTVMKTDDANDVQLRAIKALIRGTRSYAAGLTGISDQMGAEIKELNDG